MEIRFKSHFDAHKLTKSEIKSILNHARSVLNDGAGMTPMIEPDHVVIHFVTTDHDAGLPDIELSYVGIQWIDKDKSKCPVFSQDAEFKRTLRGLKLWFNTVN